MHRLVKVGTLRCILKQTEFDPDDFIAALRD
jgi:hypothetical protein